MDSGDATLVVGPARQLEVQRWNPQDLSPLPLGRGRDIARLLITGGAGFVGGHPSPPCWRAAMPAWSGQPGHRPSRLVPAGPLVQADSPMPRRWRRCSRRALDAVFHFAALSLVAEQHAQADALSRRQFGNGCG